MPETPEDAALIEAMVAEFFNKAKEDPATDMVRVLAVVRAHDASAQAAEMTALRAERDALAARLAVPGEEKLDKAQRVASIYRFEDADGEIRLGDVIGALRARVAGLEGALERLRAIGSNLLSMAEAGASKPGHEGGCGPWEYCDADCSAAYYDACLLKEARNLFRDCAALSPSAAQEVK